METRTEPKSMMWLLWVFGVAVILAIIVFTVISFTGRNYEKLISEKQQQIELLQKRSADYELKMQEYRAKAKYLAEGIIKSSSKISAIKKDIQRQKSIPISPPETTEETIRRLKEAGFDPKVDCK
jgi:F0F1-type ATP synthase membrane subunit b/b'